MSALRALVIVLPVALLWGCAQPPAPTTTTTPAETAAEPAVEVGSVEDVQPVGEMMPEVSMPSENTVYFDFDKSEIKPAARAIIEDHAKYLVENPSTRITLEGHCDERGTREYNLSLGERRANAVKRVLELSGVSGSQLEIVSYGEERPAAMGHDESAWRLNRRVAFIY